MWDLFVCASVRGGAAQAQTDIIVQYFREHGRSCFVPSEQLPLDAGLTAIEIAKGNQAGIVSSRNVLVCLDQAGEGVFYELGFADGMQKPVYFYQDEEPDDRGKIIAGRVAIAGDRVFNRNTLASLLERIGRTTT